MKTTTNTSQQQGIDYDAVARTVARKKWSEIIHNAYLEDQRIAEERVRRLEAKQNRDCSAMTQPEMFDVALVQTNHGIREMHNIRVDVSKFAKYGRPEKTLKTASKRLADLVASGDLEMDQAEECLKICHNRIEHLITKAVDLAKLMKSAYRAVKKSLKEKALAAKKAAVEKAKKFAARIATKKEEKQGKSERYCMKKIFQGVLFGLPEQKLYNDDGWENIKGAWYLNTKAKFKCVAQEAVAA